MKIDSSTVGMASARSYKATSTTIRRFTIADYREGIRGKNTALNTALNQGAENTGEPGQEPETEEAGQTQSLTDWQGRMQAYQSNYTMRSPASQTYATLRQTTIRYIFNLLFANRRSRMNQWLKDNGFPMKDYGQTSQNIRQDGNNMRYASGSIQGESFAGMELKVLNYSRTVIQTEAENTAFATVGTVCTADGRSIPFQVNVGMSRAFQQCFEEEIALESFKMCDPLVINLDTDLAELTDQSFYFDIDGDGETDQVSGLGSGSGYLALDKNEDGVINDGNELFGTSSGDGFRDLAEYDEDGNGWIDENDEIWGKLKIWCKDENGRDVLYGLAEKGVGAICLKNVSTDFTMKGEEGRTKGAVRSTGIFLYENGGAGTVQHVDVAKYSAQA